ncbi:MAG: helix-turn-helix domain-containing protein [Treponema sp.]|jgi:AraC-like DNA-binding protein/ligand-binding sensor protein|nr:helix-turn-helix domain-containing protein [Treponema sp.]
MSKANIIQRRDLEPLWFKATEVVRHYEKASDCITSVIGADCIAHELSKHPKAVFFCTLCKRYQQSVRELAPYEHPCSDMHREAVQEARKLGGSYVYTCPVGFCFWTSPFFSGERFAGAMTSSGILTTDRQQVEDRMFSVCKGEISHAEIAQYLEDIPGKSSEEVKALAQMMLLCAEQISCRDSRLDDSAGCGNRQGYRSNFLDQERSLIANLRRGDSAEAQNLVRNLLNSLNIASDGNIEHLKLKAIELVVLLSRAGTNSDNNEELVEANNRYLKRIEDSRTIEEVTDSMRLILDQMAGKLFSFQGIRHASALRKAERFIWENYNRKISLKEIADVSGLSAPYFSTIFKEEMGENLSTYLNRLRVEKASSMLRETEFPINEISAACGFEDQSWFSKIFRHYTGYSPCKYREHGEAIMADKILKPGRYS